MTWYTVISFPSTLNVTSWPAVTKSRYSPSGVWPEFEIAQRIVHLGLLTSNHSVKKAIWASVPSTTSPAGPKAWKSSASKALIPSKSLSLWASIYVAHMLAMSSGPATMSVLSAPLATENPITWGELSVDSQEIEIILIYNNNINMFFYFDWL